MHDGQFSCDVGIHPGAGWQFDFTGDIMTGGKEMTRSISHPGRVEQPGGKVGTHEAPIHPGGGGTGAQPGCGAQVIGTIGGEFTDVDG